jgi:hypothetical protein
MKHFKELVEDYYSDLPKSISKKNADDAVTNILRSKMNINDEDKKLLKKYTTHNVSKNISGSLSLNKRLIEGKKLASNQQKMHDAINNNQVPLDNDIHLYSGTSHDFGKMAKESKDGILVSPAHLSTSHKKNVAIKHLKYVIRDNNWHMIHIHAKPGNKIVHISSVSAFPEEGETIIPSGTKLKYSHSTNHNFLIKNKNGNYNQKYQVHHFTIDSQD